MVNVDDIDEGDMLVCVGGATRRVVWVVKGDLVWLWVSLLLSLILVLVLTVGR